ncbi:uncharacterized protein B0H64DRAFT_463642 [Chaetomium fimeti]|jgi:hypothetical protein|uniref:Uncharacterized protein n=1 Tax=Chaetomium fimeti TaxID=1854472 RepID=A0AAE0LRY9_9PEZI|nr:hypothetical protein B0H64DRAFT_463642 [Chaetomium fimeti]
MSSPAQGGPSAVREKEEKKGFGKKVLSRMKTVLKKATDPSSRRMSVAAAKPEPTSAPAVASTSQTAPVAEVPAAVEATKVPRSQIFAERAKKLGELYGLELPPSEWHKTEGHALRVEKPIRMRVHRKCHLCSTSFGVGRECPNCTHPRCKQCPRIPPKRTEAEKEESRKKRAAIIKERAEKAPIIPDWDPTPKKIVLKRPAKTGGQDLYYRKPRQRIRRTCCGCEKLLAGTKTCEGCQHTRCTDCPRDPPKKDKYPYGYPGDAPSARIGHYQCASCKHIFSTPPTDEPVCVKCSHTQCDRLTPRKVEPEPDPEILKSIQVKLEGLKLK